MGLERLISGIRNRFGISDDLREINLQEKERRKRLKELKRYNKDLFYLAQDKPLEVLREMYGSARFWQDAEPVLAVNYDLEPELQGQLAHTLSRFAEAEWNSDIKYLNDWRDAFFDFYGPNSTRPTEQREIFLKLLQGHDSFKVWSDEERAKQYFSILGDRNFLEVAVQLSRNKSVDVRNLSPSVGRFMADAPVDGDKKLELVRKYQSTSPDVQARVFDPTTTGEIADYRLEMLEAPEWFQEHCLRLSNEGVEKFFVPNKHLPEAVVYALHAAYFFHYSARYHGGRNWKDSGQAMGKLLSDSSIEDSSARFSIMHGAALHGRVYLNEDKFTQIVGSLDLSRETIDDYLTIKTKADYEAYGLRNSPVVAGITQRLIEASLNGEDAKRIVEAYRKNIENVRDIVGESELDYSQIHEIVGIFPELSSGDIQAYKRAVSLLERIASHQISFSRDEGRKLLDMVPELGDRLTRTIEVIDRYATIDSKVSQGQSGVCTNPIIRAIGERLVKGLLEYREDVERVVALYSDSFDRVGSLLAKCDHLRYHSANDLVSKVPELLEGGVSLENLAKMYKQGYTNQCLDDLPKLRSLVNSEKPIQRKLELLGLYDSFKNNGFEAVKDLDFDVIESLLESKLQPTGYLHNTLAEAEDTGATLRSWRDTIKTFSEGEFDPTNELHKNLEYTRFRRIVEHEKLRRHIKNHFTFTDYLTIFDRQDGTDELSLSDKDRFEIDCVAHEATLLRDYVLAVKERADKLGRDVVVVPNLSYGYLPVSPLVEELEEAGIDTIIGVKIGSTESHSNREVLNSRLFKGHRTEVANKQPVVIVVDGTYNLVTTNNRNATARYPDAHQGYLNQVIALNEAMGFTDEDYSHVGKSSDDVSRLRVTEEFKRAVDVYSGVIIGDRPRQPYQFQLWNTAGMELAVRGNREIAITVKPYDGKVEGPAMIFCNVGVLDEQVPEEIKARFEGQHKPAYFDDSGKKDAYVCYFLAEKTGNYYIEFEIPPATAPRQEACIVVLIGVKQTTEE